MAQAVQAQKAAYDQLDPSLQKLADQYTQGKLTAKDFSTATQGLPAQQADLVSQFTTASKAVVKKALRKAIEPVTGDAVFVDDWKTVTDDQGNLAWKVWAHR